MIKLIRIAGVTISIVATLYACGTEPNATFTASTSPLISISVTPANPSIAKGTTQQLTAAGYYSDGTTKEVTSVVSWSSSSGTQNL